MAAAFGVSVEFIDGELIRLTQATDAYVGHIERVTKARLDAAPKRFASLAKRAIECASQTLAGGQIGGRKLHRAAMVNTSKTARSTI